LEELKNLLEPQAKDTDLVDRLLSLLDRQTDHRLSPHMLMGFLGLFNMLSIMSLIRGNQDTGIKQIGSSGAGEGEEQGLSAVENLANMLSAPGGGQPDLMGILGNVASKKKINPGLLLSLMSMLNSQGSTSSSQENTGTAAVAEGGGSAGQHGEAAPEPAVINHAGEREPEKKTTIDEPGGKNRYDRKRGSG
jgi:hypothetical protein